MIAVPTGVRVYLAAGATDMRKGFDGLAMVVQGSLGRDPFVGDVFAFRGRGGDPVKLLYFGGRQWPPPPLPDPSRARQRRVQSAGAGLPSQRGHTQADR